MSQNTRNIIALKSIKVLDAELNNLLTEQTKINVEIKNLIIDISDNVKRDDQIQLINKLEEQKKDTYDKINKLHAKIKLLYGIR